MSFIQQTFGFLTQSPEDTTESKGITAVMTIIFLALTVLFFISSTEPQADEFKIIVISGFMLLFSLAVIAIDAKKLPLIDIVSFISFDKILIGSLAGIIGYFMFSIFLGGLICNDVTFQDRYIREGFCVINEESGQAQLLLPTQQILPVGLRDFYTVAFAPFTEELIFRAILFWTLLKVLKSTQIGKALATNNPILVYFTLASIIGFMFAIFHFFAATGTCSGLLSSLGQLTDENQRLCAFDRIFVSELYNFFWLTFNLYFGLSFSLAGHALNNASVIKSYDASGNPVPILSFQDFALSLVGILLFLSVIRGLFKKR